MLDCRQQLESNQYRLLVIQVTALSRYNMSTLEPLWVTSTFIRGWGTGGGKKKKKGSSKFIHLKIKKVGGKKSRGRCAERKQVKD